MKDWDTRLISPQFPAATVTINNSSLSWLDLIIETFILQLQKKTKQIE